MTVENLQSISNHLNNGTLPADNLSSKIEMAIKKTAAENMRNDSLYPVSDVKIEGFGMRYFGTYNGSIAVLMSNVYLNYPAEDLNITVEIEGVCFHYSDPRIIEIWVKI